MPGGSITSGVSVVGSATSTSSSAISSNQSRALSDGRGALKMASHRAAGAYVPKQGDVFIHVADGGFIGHCNIISPDIAYKIDSVDPDGVREVMLTSDTERAVVFRFQNEAIAQQAAQLAKGWAPKERYNAILNPEPKAQVGYSSGPSIGIGITARVIHNVFGSSKFGSGAQGRLKKYRERPGKMPKNMICSELCVLAYQLSMVEGAEGFPKIDAKHTTPTVLYRYLMGPGKAHWSVVGYRHMPDVVELP